MEVSHKVENQRVSKPASDREWNRALLKAKKEGQAKVEAMKQRKLKAKTNGKPSR